MCYHCVFCLSHSLGQTIEAWLQSGHPSGVEEAETLLRQILTDSSIHMTDNPDEIDRINGAFALVLYAVSRDAKGFQRADELVRCMQELYDNDNIPLRPNTTALNATMNLWAKRGHVERVSNMLRDMMDSHDGSIAPNDVSFNAAILAFAKRGDPQKASNVVRVMIGRYARGLLLDPPNTVAFNGVLDAWAKSGHAHAGQRAEEVLQWMAQENIQADTWSHNCVIDAYSKTDNGALQAESMLRRMMELQEQGYTVGPDEFSFTAVVHAWANHSSADSAERATAIVKLMEDLQDAGYRGIGHVVSPYNALIHAWANSKNADRVKKVMDILEHMERRPEIEPNNRTYTSIITALVKSGETGVNEALRVLHQMENRLDSGETPVGLDTVMYNAVLSGLAKSKRADAVDVAQDLIHRMEQRDQVNGDDRCSPNTITYNTVMDILSKGSGTDLGVRAEAILNQMEKLYQSGRQKVKPSANSYRTCMSAWARSNHCGKVPRAQAILDRMKEASRSGDRDLRPCVLAYNTLLNCCSFPVGGPDEREYAASVVLKTLQELRDSDTGGPDFISYLSALKAIGRCIPCAKRRDELVEKEFACCCDDGQVNELVLQELQQASANEYTKQFGSANPREAASQVPREWRRNISLRSKYKSR